MAYADNYIRKSHPLKQRISAIWHILTNRNFILIAGINHFEENGKKGTRVKTIFRTDNDSQSDHAACALAGASVPHYEPNKKSIVFILNDAIGQALFTRRIKSPDSNKVAEFVSGYLEREGINGKSQVL